MTGFPPQITQTSGTIHRPGRNWELGKLLESVLHESRVWPEENLRWLRRLDELYLEGPFFGSRRMAVRLKVNRKRIQRLMWILGIEALYPELNLSRPALNHEVYVRLQTSCAPAGPGVDAPRDRAV